MHKAYKLLPILCLTVVFATPALAQKQDQNPERIFRRCKSSVNDTTERCVRAMNQKTDLCVQLIERLLSEGKVERARAAGRECIHELEVISASCRRQIDTTCRRCIRVLVELEAHKLARELHRICGRAKETIRRAEARNKNRIQQLF